MQMNIYFLKGSNKKKDTKWRKKLEDSQVFQYNSIIIITKIKSKNYDLTITIYKIWGPYKQIKGILYQLCTLFSKKPKWNIG